MKDNVSIMTAKQPTSHPSLGRWEIVFAGDGIIHGLGASWEKVPSVNVGASLPVGQHKTGEHATIIDEWQVLLDSRHHINDAHDHESATITIAIGPERRACVLKGDITLADASMGAEEAILYRYSPVEVTSLVSQAEQMQSIIDSLPQACLVQKEGVALFANQALAKMLGVHDTTALLVSDSIAEFVASLDRQLISQLVTSRSFDPAEDVQFRYNLKLHDLEIISTLCTLSQINWFGEQVTLVTINDVSRMTTEKAERDRIVAMFAQVFNQSPDMIAIIRLSDGVYVDVNSAWLDSVGQSRDDVKGRSVNDVDVWVDPSFSNWLFSQLRTHSVLRDVPVKLKGRGGLIRDIILVVETINSDEGALLMLIGRDVTDDIERQTELQQSRDEARMANRTKSEFLANMSHELRTPLNAILGFSEMIANAHLGKIGNPKYQEYGKDIYNSGVHLLDIINEILDLSKIEADRLEMTITTVDVVEIGAECLRLVKTSAEKGGIELKGSLAGTLPAALDRRLMKQIILNLLTNAVKFTERDGRVDIAVERLAAGGGRVTVSDSGIGMSPQDIEVALTPFGQVFNPKFDTQEGTGLGLPIVAALCEKQGMALDIQSTPGDGTQVTISIPEHLITNLDAVEDDQNVI